MTELIPAILTNDISDFRKKYAELFALSDHFTKLHVDFADGRFVDNKTIMPHDLGFLKSSPFTLSCYIETENSRSPLSNVTGGKANYKKKYIDPKDQAGEVVYENYRGAKEV